LLLTRIPFFRDVIVSSFVCHHCGNRNQEIQFGGVFDEKGVQIELTVLNMKVKKIFQTFKDLNRQIVKSDYCTLTIPEIDLQMPPETQKGSINTIEGLLTATIEGLQNEQPVRKHTEVEVFEKIEKICTQLRTYLEGKTKFTISIDDPAGNSAIEGYDSMNKEDPQIKRKHYERTKEQNRFLGLGYTQEEAEDEMDGKKVEEKKIQDKKDQEESIQQSIISNEEADKLRQSTITTDKEILHFKETCFNCQKNGELQMIVCDIPHFKEIVLMAFTCDHCGFRSSEVKPGGDMSEKGTKIVLNVKTEEDLSRDILKSESASIMIKECELEITPGSLGGRFTTIEGLLRTLKEKLEVLHSFNLGDAEGDVQKVVSLTSFLQQLEDYADGKEPFTLIIDDPISNSYVQNLYAPDPDPEMTIEKYIRTFEQDEELGIHQMKVD
jgi:zinc finger protein